MSENHSHRHIEKLINRYYDHLMMTDETAQGQPTDNGTFDRRGVFRRIQRGMGTGLAFFRVRKVWQFAAAAVLLLSACLLGYQYRYSLKAFFMPVKMVEISTANGEIEQLMLQDGTKIWLNAGSKLAYPATFDEAVREVQLTGEAYFEVARNPLQPFVIHCNELTTRVLGTSFNIKAYAETAKITVTVLTGEVAVSNSRSHLKALLLQPNQTAVYDREHNLLTQEQAGLVASTVGWKDGKLAYQSTPLKDILADIQRKYNIEIEAGKNLRNCSISAEFNDDSMEKILRILAELVNGKITYKEKVYYLEGKGC